MNPVQKYGSEISPCLYTDSLRSPLTFFELQNVDSGKTVRVTNGARHLEKNWRKSFPKKWIWYEGISRDPSNVTIATCGGLVDLSFISVNAYLIGYRSPSAGTDLSFRPETCVVIAWLPLKYRAR